MRLASLALVGIILASRVAAGQSPTDLGPAIARAQQRASSGDSAAARAILDSLTRSNLETDVQRAEVSYWNSRFAPTPADRERQLVAMVVDYPFSPRIGPALFELGVLELSHSSRERAAVHLARFLATTTRTDSNRTAASLALGKILFDRGEGVRACAVLLAGRAEVPPTAVETMNQFDFSAAPCRGVDTSFVPPPVDTTTRSVIGEYTVQVAAYDTRTQADRFATRLRGQGLDARVIGTTKPFRVRVGHYVTRPEAEAEAKRIGTILNMKPFVVMVGTEEK